MAGNIDRVFFVSIRHHPIARRRSTCGLLHRDSMGRLRFLRGDRRVEATRRNRVLHIRQLT
ncbi:hypothetical protein C7S13_4515 [Burkholderia cepacia]|nr:hypothetical protein [Burkholderia cepacia]